MSRVSLAKQITRYHELHAKAKEIDGELDELKKAFKDRAGEQDAVFECGDLQVPVTWKERAGGWNTPALEAELGDKAAKFKKAPTRYAEVTCRKKDAA